MVMVDLELNTKAVEDKPNWTWKELPNQCLVQINAWLKSNKAMEPSMMSNYGASRVLVQLALSPFSKRAILYGVMVVSVPY